MKLMFSHRKTHNELILLVAMLKAALCWAVLCLPVGGSQTHETCADLNAPTLLWPTGSFPPFKSASSSCCRFTRAICDRLWNSTRSRRGTSIKSVGMTPVSSSQQGSTHQAQGCSTPLRQGLGTTQYQHMQRNTVAHQ